MRDVVVVGSLNVDVSVQARRLPRPGETVRASGLALGPGGKGLNQAIAASRLGAHVHMLGRLGEDRFAEIPENALQDAGIDASYVRRLANETTGTALIVVEETSGQNAIAVDAGANRLLSTEDVMDAVALFRASGVLLVQLELPLETVEAALDLAKQNHVITVLDPAPARKLTDSILQKVDVLTPNETEVEALTGLAVSDVESAARAGSRLRDRTLGDVVVTLGERGCVWVSSIGFEHIHAPKVQPIDTTAAGDAFNGGLAVALARGEPLGKALQTAIQAGSAATLDRGAAAAMPRPEDLAALPS